MPLGSLLRQERAPDLGSLAGGAALFKETEPVAVGIELPSDGRGCW